MNLIKENRIETLTQAFSRMPKTLNKKIGPTEHMLEVRRAGFSEIRIFSALYIKWSDEDTWVTESQRETKTRLRYSMDGDEEFYHDVLNRTHTALVRMKLDAIHNTLCDKFMSGFTKQLNQLTGLNLIKPTGVIL